MRLGINGSVLLAAADLDMITGDIVAMEQTGFSSYWLAQTGLVDALTALAHAGPSTSTITLGTAVVPTWPQHPQALAAQVLTTHAATGGRTILGIGLGHQRAVEGMWRTTWTKPIRHMLDYLDVLPPLLTDGRADVDGAIWGYAGEHPRPVSEPPSVMLAALGDQMLDIAGRRTDGTILWCVGPKTLRDQIVPKINAAAASADRLAPAVVCSLPVWVTDDPDTAHGVVATSLAAYNTLPSYRAMLDIEGVDGPADIALIGSAEQVIDGIGRIREAGATDFTAVIPTPDPTQRNATVEAIISAAGGS